MLLMLSQILVAMTSIAGSEPAASSALLFPAECRPGEACLIQKLFDHDPGPGRSDYRCGLLTTDGHDGIDIRLRTMAAMRSGVAVVAARAGTVLRTRDGEADAGLGGPDRAGGKDAGNAVVIDHGDGWETQYSHLRQGSVRVRPGQVVKGGEVLGLIGLSGNSEFPHLHFTVRHGGVAVDPFVGLEPFAGCGTGTAYASLWSRSLAAQLAYAPAGVISAGLSSEIPPSPVTMRDPPPALAGTHAPLILWVDAFGARRGDRQEFSIIGPRGEAVHTQVIDVDKGGLSWFAYSGKRPSAAGWIKGRYVGRYRIVRAGAVAAEVETSAFLQ